MKKQLTIILLISFLLCNLMAFLDEGLYSFNYLTQLGDWVALIMYTIIFAIVPIAILVSSKKPQKQSFYNSLFGFSLAVILILVML